MLLGGTSCARTLVHESVLEAASPARGGLIPIVCVHGDTHEYPTMVVKLTTTKGSFKIEVGVIKTHTHLLGSIWA